jgi:hypothetical protein
MTKSTAFSVSQAQTSKQGWQANVIDVPVMVDEVKNLDQFQMTRCVYYIVEAPDPHELVDHWAPEILRLRDQQAPIALFGLVGLIHRPSTSVARFKSVQQIDSLFDAIELRAKLLVQLADLWLPNFIVDLVRQTPVRGDVYRIGIDLFKIAHAYRAGRISAAEFYLGCETHAQTIEFSESETEVFAGWASAQMDVARRNQQRLVDRGTALPVVVDSEPDDQEAS